MKKFHLMLVAAVLWLAACGTEASNNGNAAAVPSPENGVVNANADNANTEKPVAEEEEEEVPDFTDASEALKKGEEYLDRNETEKAIEALKQAVELDPDLADAHFRLGIAYSLVEAEEEAEVTPPEDEPTPEKKGRRAKEKKSNSTIAFENAVKAYRKHVARNPKDAAAYFNLGRAYNKLGSDNDDDARKALEKAVRLDDENSLYRTELGAVLIELAKYPEAIRQLNKAIELDEDNLRAEDLLEIARAGKKRTDFNKDKP